MRIVLLESFQTDVRNLSDELKAQVLDILVALAPALREPQRHTGLGLRKVHRSGVWEVRLGLGLRLLFLLAAGEAIFLRVGSHDEIRRYLRGL